MRNTCKDFYNSFNQKHKGVIVIKHGCINNVYNVECYTETFCEQFARFSKDDKNSIIATLKKCMLFL